MKRFRTWFLTLAFAAVAFGHGCRCARLEEPRASPVADSPGQPSRRSERSIQDPRPSGPGRILILPEGREAGVLGESPVVGSRNGDKAGHTRFQQAYFQGIALMEKGNYADAIRIFERIAIDFPNSEEASIAAYCIADAHFRNKSNAAALAAFKRVVERYPHSQAAQNARAAITYIENFAIHELEYVSPDVEARQRRGR